MLRKIILFIKFCCFIILFGLAVFYGDDVSIGMGKFSINLHASILVLLTGSVYFIWMALKNFCNSLIAVFCKSSQEKGLENLQTAFSKMLLKDKSFEVLTHLEKAKKYLGDIPIISWLKGQFHLMNGNDQKAKAIFYGLFEKEKHSAFGALGLYKLAVKEDSAEDALLAIESLSEFSASQSLCFTAITLALKSKNFGEAKKYIDGLRRSKKFETVEAILLSEEGMQKENVDLLKKAFKVCPDFEENNLRYVDALLKEEKIRKAKNVLRESFELSPSLNLFRKYVFVCEENETSSEKFKHAESLAESAPNSWVGYFGLGEMAFSEKMYSVAFNNFLKAYKNENYDFILKRLIEAAEAIEDPKSAEVINVLSTPLPGKPAKFAWKCEHCGAVEQNWIPVCGHCSRIGEYHYVNLAEIKNFGDKRNNLQLSDYSVL